MKRLLVGFIPVVLAVVLAECHTGFNDDNNQEYCQGVEEASNAVREADISHGGIEGELLSDVNELGADGHCPGYDPNDSDPDG